jgi:hypothetical protein
LTLGDPDQSEFRFLAVLSATVVNGTTATCSQIPGLPVTPQGTVLRFSHDGTIFSPSFLPYALVGTANGLAVVAPVRGITAFVRVATVTTLPIVEVNIVDIQGNSLHNLDQGARAITLTASLQTTVTSGNSIAFGNSSDATALSQLGSARFSRLRLATPPPSGVLVLTASHTSATGIWSTEVEITLLVGRAVGLQFAHSIQEWVVGVQRERALDPAPEVLVVDAGGNTVTDRSQFPPSVTLGFDYDEPGEKGQVVSSYRTFVAVADSVNPSFKFGSIKMRGVYGRFYAVSLSAPNLDSTRTPAIDLEDCGSVAAFGRPGEFQCRRCPVGGECDGRDLVQVEEGYWRGAPDSYSLYECSSGACGRGSCQKGYRGPKCSVCVPGYGQAGKSCIACPSPALNTFIVVIVAVALLLGMFLFVINSMGDPSETGKSKDRFTIVLKMLLTYLQVIGQAKEITQPGYQVLGSIFETQQQASALTTDFPFIKCQFESTFLDEFIAINVAPIFLIVLMGLIVSLYYLVRRRFTVAASFETFYTAELQKYRADLVSEEDPRILCSDLEFDAILEAVSEERPAQRRATVKKRSIWGSSRGSLLPSPLSTRLPMPTNPPPASPTAVHLHERTDVPAQLNLDEEWQRLMEGEIIPLGASEEDGAAQPPESLYRFHFPVTNDQQSARASSLSLQPQSPARNEALRLPDTELLPHPAEPVLMKADETDPTTLLIQDRSLLSRVVEWLAVTAVIILFLLYPTLLQTAAKMLRCESLDFGDSTGTQSVLIAERTVSCSGAAYQRYRIIAVSLLVLWGLGIPAFSVAIVKLIKRVTLFQQQVAANTLFFFMTGGMKPEYWFWEATVMARKAFIMIIMVLVPYPRLKTYMSIWVFLLFFVLQVIVKPYQDDTLSRLELGSLTAIIVTFNLLLLQPMFDPDSTPVLFYGLLVLTILVNALMILAFFVLLCVSGKEALRNLVARNPRFASLKTLFEVTVEEEAAKVVLLTDEVRQQKRMLKNQRPLDGLVANIWNFLLSRPESKEDRQTIYLMTRFQRARQSLLVELRGPEAYNCYLDYLEAERALFNHVRFLQSRALVAFHNPDE